MADRPIDAVVAGHICLDITPAFPEGLGADPARIFVPGRLINMGAPTISTGGAVANTGLALLRLGCETRLMGKVANDSFGDTIRAIVREAGGGEAMSVVEGESSSYSVVLAPPGVDRMFLHSCATNDTFGAEDIDYDVVARARLFHFGYPPLMRRMYENDGAEMIALFRRVKETGVTVSLDLAYADPPSPAGRAPWRAILEETLPHVDLFVPSVEEALYMLDRPAFEALAARSTGGDPTEHLGVEEVMKLGETILDMGPKAALIKCGARGLYLRTGSAERIAAMGPAAPDSAAWADRERWEVSFKVPVVSATGSGDTAIAGFLAALLKGESAARALTLGVGVGACNVQAPDALGGIRPWEETTAYVDGLTQKLPFTVDAAGWRYDESGGAWIGPNDRSA